MDIAEQQMCVKFCFHLETAAETDLVLKEVCEDKAMG